MYDRVWQVQVFGGDDDIDMHAPLKFGVPTVYTRAMGEDRPDEPPGPTVPLLYGPVGIRQAEGWMAIYTLGEMERLPDGSATAPMRDWREIEHVTSVKFTDWGAIVIEGLEQRADGTAVFVRWEVEPFEPVNASEDRSSSGE